MKKLSPTQIQQREYQERSRKNTQLIQTFCHTLVDAFGYKAVKDKRRSAVYWLDGKGRLNQLLVRYQLRPHWYCDDTPWIVRICINSCYVKIPKTAERELRGSEYVDPRSLDPTIRPNDLPRSDSESDRRWIFEFTLFPEQLQQAIPWLVHFAHNKDRGVFDETIVPPFACRWWGTYTDHCRYAWSRDAHIAFEAWNEPRIRARERDRAAIKKWREASCSKLNPPDKPAGAGANHGR